MFFDSKEFITIFLESMISTYKIIFNALITQPESLAILIFLAFAGFTSAALSK